MTIKKIESNVANKLCYISLRSGWNWSIQILSRWASNQFKWWPLERRSTSGSHTDPGKLDRRSSAALSSRRPSTCKPSKGQIMMKPRNRFNINAKVEIQSNWSWLMPNEKCRRQAHPTNTLAVPSANETRSRVHAVAFILLVQCKS